MGSDPLLSYLHVVSVGTGEVYMACDSGPPVSMTCLINQQDRQFLLLNGIDTIDETRTSRGRVGVVKLHEIDMAPAFLHSGLLDPAGARSSCGVGALVE